MKQLMEMPTTMPSGSEGTRMTRGKDNKQSRGVLPKNLIRPLLVPKNLIRPLLVQDLEDEGFGRPALSIADARRPSG